MPFADRIHSTAKKLIDKYGSDVTLLEVVQGEYNPALGKPDETIIRHDVKAVVAPFDQSLVVAGVVSYNDIRMTFYSSDIHPDSSWRVEVGGVEMKIVQVLNKTSTQNKMIVYDLQVRNK